MTWGTSEIIGSLVISVKYLRFRRRKSEVVSPSLFVRGAESIQLNPRTQVRINPMTPESEQNRASSDVAGEIDGVLSQEQMPTLKQEPLLEEITLNISLPAVPTMNTDNPLLSFDYRIPFDAIKASDVEPAIAELIAEARAKIDQITVPQERTYENTLLALEEATLRLSLVSNVLQHLESVATYPEWRAAFNATREPLSQFYSSITLNEDLWNALKEYSETDEAKSLTGVKARFLQKTLEEFKREGAELPPEKKDRLAELDVTLAKLNVKFHQNVLDSTNSFEIVLKDQAELKGLPESAVAAARLDAERKGLDGWRFTLQGPSYLAVMTYLDDPKIREQVYRAYNTKASTGAFDNSAIIGEILELRKERAELLGFKDFSDLVLEDRMAKKGETAAQFVDDLRVKVEPHVQRENQELLAFRRGIEGPGAPAMAPWDISYYAEKMRLALYEFNEEDLRPYFPLNRTMDALFKVAEKLYGITVTTTDTLPTWNPDVTTYEVKSEGGDVIGHFYVDLHPRESKRGGAWMNGMVSGKRGDGLKEPHLGLICGNMTEPLDGKPALLTHDEVRTLFHEFGHLLHHMLSDVEVRSLAGTNVAWDFVELPSQIMENWTLQREVIDLIGGHYETGERLPDELWERFERAKNFRSANWMYRQLGLAAMDLALHREYDPAKDGSVKEYARELQQRFSSAPLPPEYAMVNSFNHIFSSRVGYAAGYYSYLWAEVLDADAFTRFEQEGLFNKATGESFKREILSRGDSEDPAVLFKQFMGREPDPSALLKRAGL